MSEYDVLINKYDALKNNYDQLYPKPMKHANTHASGGSDPITPGDIGAYSKNEIDAFLANKMGNALGQAGANLLEWASAQTVGGAFYINPTVTTADVPIVTWYAGLLEVNGGGRRMIISTSGGGAPKTYVNVTSAGIWQGWERIATATDLDTKVSKSGDTMTGNLTISKGISTLFLAVPDKEYRSEFIKNASSAVDLGTIISDVSSYSGKNYSKIVLCNATKEFSYQTVDSGKLTGNYQILHSGNAQSLGFPKIAIGSYVGTGTYYSANPNSLTFDFEPKVLIVVADGANSHFPGFAIVRGQGYSNGIGSYSNSSAGYALTITWSGNSVSWFTTNTFDFGKANAQLNAEGVTYRYIALG